MSTVSPGMAPAQPADAKKQEPCPRCGKPLTDAAGLGWCSACGYCRSLEEGKNALPVAEKTAAKRPSVGGLVELGEAVGGLPRWFWIMLMGVAMFTVFSLLPNRLLKPDSFERALWTTCQIGLGCFVIYCAQLLALLQIAADDEKLTFRDTIMPFRLWPLTCKRLPQTRLAVWLGAWGLSMVLSALIFIGGLPHWLNYLPGAKPLKGQKTVQKR